MKKPYLLLIAIACVALSIFGYIKYHHMNLNEIGLQVLSWVKKIKGQSIDLGKLEKQVAPIMDHQLWSELLQIHVDESGKVSYDGFMKDSAKLADYLSIVSHHPPGVNWSEADKLAYWINAYNAFTVQLILDHYPLKSIKDISNGLPMINSPWDIKFFNIGNISMDLNTIEHEILRKQFEEPRIHFAINCASVSCPKLRNEAYTAQRLDFQLEDQTIAFLNNPEKNRISESETRLSPIFDWFTSDFTKQTDLISFLQAYQVRMNTNNPIKYMEYNWSLNN